MMIKNMSAIKEEMINIFTKYCKNCKGQCCIDGADFTVFGEELKKIKLKNISLPIKNQWGRYGKPAGVEIERVSLNGPCPFVNTCGCGLNLADKPLDCLTYPIYPIIKYYKNKKKEIVGMMVHKSCPFCIMISKNMQLVGLIKKLWATELEKIPDSELKHWFGDKRNYWLDKNIIKV